MYAVSEEFLTALRAPHGVDVHVEAWVGLTRTYDDVPVTGGEVTVDASSDVRRSLSASMALPAGTQVADVLSAYSTELRVWRGVRWPDGTVERVPLGRFRVDSITTGPSGEVKVTGTDHAKRVAEARFLVPTQSVTANTVVASITALITAVDAAFTVTDRTGSTTSTPSVLWDRERWEAVNDLATSIGAIVFFDPDGVAVIANQPAVTDPVVWMIDAGEPGVMIDFEAATSRERTYNGVVATGERSDGTTPVVATVLDTDTGSPTYWYGPFGKVPYFFASPLLTTTGQATAAAASILNRTRALNRQLRLSCVPNPALDAGDVVTVRMPDSSYERAVVDSLTVPLDVAGVMSVQTRSTRPDTE